MATIRNEITVNASIERVWTMLTDLELLDKYDPTVKNSTLVSSEKTGLGAKRKVKQIMEYTVKFGILGRSLDTNMIRKQSDAGIKKFFAGLKSCLSPQFFGQFFQNGFGIIPRFAHAL